LRQIEKRGGEERGGTANCFLTIYPRKRKEKQSGRIAVRKSSVMGNEGRRGKKKKRREGKGKPCGWRVPYQRAVFAGGEKNGKNGNPLAKLRIHPRGRKEKRRKGGGPFTQRQLVVERGGKKNEGKSLVAFLGARS